MQWDLTRTGPTPRAPQPTETIELAVISPAVRSRMMRSIRKEHTKPELVVRRMVRELGSGYRLYARDLPGNPDIVLRKRRRVIFVHGCFWHQHPGCGLAKRPNARPEYWLPKFARTQERDRTALMALERSGWSTLVVWECELDALVALRAKLERFLGAACRTISLHARHCPAWTWINQSLARPGGT